jgi:segregation and condensation protein B
VSDSPEDDVTAPRSESLFRAPPLAEQERMVEAMLFASAEPLGVAEMEARMPHGCDPAEALQLCANATRGAACRWCAWARAGPFRTAADLGFLMAREVVETRRLSRAAIETLAIIAYHQPVTRAEIEEIRGVSASRGTVDQLIELGWIRFGRRRMTVGRPVTFVVTQGFLDHFGLENARDLPGLKELREAGLLDSRPGDPEEAELPRGRYRPALRRAGGSRGRERRRLIMATFARILRAKISMKGRAGPMDRIVNMIIRQVVNARGGQGHRQGRGIPVRTAQPRWPSRRHHARAAQAGAAHQPQRPSGDARGAPHCSGPAHISP